MKMHLLSYYIYWKITCRSCRSLHKCRLRY